MAPSHRDVDILRSYTSIIRLQVAYCSQAQVCQVATEANPFFVAAFEGGRNDGGIRLGSPSVSEDITERFFDTVEGETSTKNLVPVDIKSIAPMADTRGEAVYWRAEFTFAQLESCQVAILTAAKDPGYVAVVPMYCFRQRPMPLSPMGRRHNTQNIRPVWTLHPLPAFPPEFAPFIRPLSQLEEALTNIRDITNANLPGSEANTTPYWYNRHTGVRFRDVPAPVPQHHSTLEPDFTPWRKGLEEIRRLYQAFRKYSQDFTIEFVRIAPLIGDFKIIYTEGGVRREVFVEMKSGHCRVSRDTLEHAQAALHYTQRAIFTWKAKWDYIFTHIDQDRAIFIPRDEIPKEWWNAAISTDRSFQLQWPAQKPFEHYMIDLSCERGSVRDLEAVLRRRRSETGSMRAQIPIDIDVDTDRVADESDDNNLRPESKWSTRGFQRGFGSPLHESLRGATYEVWASEALLKLCRQRGEGLVLDLGKLNPACRFVMMRFTWSQVDKDQYDRDGEPPYRHWHIDKRTPILPLTFLPMKYTSGYHAYTTDNTLFTADKLIANRLPSLLVCDLFSYTCIRLTHSRFIVTSDQLASYIPRRSVAVFKDFDDGPLDRYHVDEDEVLDVIMGLLSGRPQVQIGLCNLVVDTSDYCHQLRQVLSAGVDGFMRMNPIE